MLLPQKLIWAEGVILTQQHFQQWDLYLQQQQNMWATSITPYFWGLREISIDEELLKVGQIVLKKCQVIFPGGLYVHYEENNDLPLSYRIQPSDKIKTEIYLALPLGKAITEIPGYPRTSHLSTWRSDFQMIKDEYDDDREREIMLAKPNLVLLSDADNLDQFHSIKILEINKISIDQYQQNDRYIPPVMHIGASNELQLFCNRTLSLFNAKIKYIKDRTQLTVLDSQALSHHHFVCLFILQTLQKSIPLLKHFANTYYTHPERLYCCLISLIAELSAISKKYSVYEIPNYQHALLTDTFRPIASLLQGLLDEILVSQDFQIELLRISATRYETNAIDVQYLENNSFYLAIYFEGNSLSWVDKCAGQIKIGSHTVIDAIVALALPGMKIIHTQRLPQQLTVKAGYEYFYIEPHGEYWEKIKQDKKMVVFVPSDFVNAIIELVAVQK